MLVCRYVGGGASEIGDREYENIGQYAELSEEQFASVVLGGAAFLPTSEFDKVGFTDEELELNGPFGTRSTEDSVFQEKLSAAQAAYTDIRKRLQAGESVTSLFGAVSTPEVEKQAPQRRQAPQPRILKEEPKSPEAVPEAEPLFGRQES